MADDSTAGHTSTVAGPSVCHVIHDRGSSAIHFDRQTVETLLRGDGFFWLDLDQPASDDFEAIRKVLSFHPLAIEDSEHLEQRADLGLDGERAVAAPIDACSRERSG